jgi:hypothetical protein
MPPVVAAAASAVTIFGIEVAVSAATAALIEAFVIGTLVSVGTSLASRALLGQPDDFADRGQTLSFRAATPPAQIVYGETRVGGPVVFMTTTGGAREFDNQLLWLVIALAGHEVEAIGDVYFSDEVVEFQPESVVNPGNGWRGEAIGETQGDPGGGLGQANGYAHLIKRLGSSTQTVNPNFISGFGFWNLKHYGIMDENDTFKGVAHLSVVLNYAPTLFPAGPPNMSALVKGRKVYDPRAPAHDIDNPATWAWSANAALCVADFLRGCPMDTGGGVIVRPFGVQAKDDEIDWASVAAAANICDESVQKATGGTESRYTCNGMIDSDVSPEDGLKALLSSMAGYMAWSGGQWKLFAGAYRTPTVTLGDDDQCGPAKTQAKRARRDLFNGVKGKFRGPKTFYQVADFPAINSATYVDQDNGEEIWQDIELPFTDSPSTCQRIARLELLRNRQQIITDRRFKLSALATQVGDTILLNDPRKGWVSKPFEIHRWSLASAQDENGQPYLCIDMTLHETSSGVYAWTADDEFAFDDAPDTNLPRPWDVAVPGAPGIVEELYQTREGAGVRTRVTLSWADSLESYFLDYIAEYKLTSASTWTVLPPVTSTFIIVNDLAAGVYDFRVQTRNRLGVPSLYSTSMWLTVYGLGAAPATLTNLGIQPLGNQAMLAWDQSADLDVREGGYIEFRHSPAFSSVTWENSTGIREAVPGNASAATVPLKAGTYVIRPVDSSGIAGAITTVSSKQASINGFSALTGSPLTEETTFAGTHSFTVATANILKLSNAGLWDDIADLDLLLTNIDETGGLALSGTYTFANAYNFGAVTRARLTSKIAASSVDVTAGGIDDRTANIDDWEDFDGASSAFGGVVDAWVEFRQTDDAASPTWTAWMRLDTAEVECRQVQARAQLRSFDSNYNIEIATLQVAAEQRT